MNKHKELSTLEEIKAFSDPYRLQIITTFREFNRPATVKEVAVELNETPAKVHYHVKKLEKLNILELVETKVINGIIAKYYLPTAEHFTLKRNDENDELNKVILTETQRAISHLYDKSKNNLFDLINIGKPSNTADIVFDDNVYLTDDEFEELKQLLQRITSKKPTEEEKQNLTSYHLFAVYYQK